MGVHLGSKFLYSLAGLTFGQLSSVARERAKNAPDNRWGKPDPAVTADISWLCHKLRKKAPSETVSTVVAFLSKFIDEGFVLYAAFDPEGRHHTKKASVR